MGRENEDWIMKDEWGESGSHYNDNDIETLKQHYGTHVE